MVEVIPWLLSALTISMMVMAGNKHPWAWALGLVNQALWLGWILASRNYGLLPMNLALWFVYVRNHIKWNVPERVACDVEPEESEGGA